MRDVGKTNNWESSHRSQGLFIWVKLLTNSKCLQSAFHAVIQSNLREKKIKTHYVFLCSRMLYIKLSPCSLFLSLIITAHIKLHRWEVFKHFHRGGHNLTVAALQAAFLPTWHFVDKLPSLYWGNNIPVAIAAVAHMEK